MRLLPDSGDIVKGGILGNQPQFIFEELVLVLEGSGYHPQKRIDPCQTDYQQQPMIQQGLHLSLCLISVHLYLLIS